jgi:hypothetical protein
MATKVAGLNGQQWGFLLLGIGGILGGLSGLESFAQLATPGQVFPLLASLAGLIGGVLTRPTERSRSAVDSGTKSGIGKTKGGAIGYRGPRRDESGGGSPKD